MQAYSMEDTRPHTAESFQTSSFVNLSDSDDQHFYPTPKENDVPRMSNSASAPSSSPSPPAPSTSLTPTTANATRRPPRKSTLTQQQKNQKRQRATQDQLNILEIEFNVNPTPTAVVRERIAQEINMTERSVQIWFQNRRAKIKLMAKKSIETGEECEAIPESMRQYLALQAAESGMMITPEPSPAGKIVIHHFGCRSLSIGTWRRVGQNTMDLVIFYSPEKACITYYINNDSAGYKIEYPFAYVKDIQLETLDLPSSSNGGQKQGQLVITLHRPPEFFMDSSGSGGFYQCADFTEDQQASQILTHHLGGNAKLLTHQLAKLMTLEQYINRDAHFFNRQQQAQVAAIAQAQQHAVAASAPVSPQHRPHSANDIVAPTPTFSFSQHLQQLDTPHSHIINPYKHKRTRSRSVPIAVDFSQLHAPMPNLSFSHHHLQSPNHSTNDHLFAPQPQHHGSNLRIDTSTGYLDFSRTYPLSATTASPSEFASPLLQPHMDMAPQDMHAHTPGYASPYSLPWLSPMVDPSNLGIAPSISPLSAMTPEPLIASNSPPSAADLYPSVFAPHEQDGVSLGDIYNAKGMMTGNPMVGSPAAVEEAELAHSMGQFTNVMTPEGVVLEQ